jgi:hypothetical protein
MKVSRPGEGRSGPVPLLRNSRKTERGAIRSRHRLAARAAPFALLSVFLVLPPGAVAQEQPPPAKPDVSLPSVRSFKMIRLAGNGGMNDLERKVMSPLVVQVLDQNDRPVDGAEVIFRFPLRGASAVFADQKTSQTVRTNADGQAAAVGWTANDQVGTFQVVVTASRGNELGETTVSMTNVTRIVAEEAVKKKHWWSSRWAKIGIAAGAAGAVVAIVLATRDSGTAGPGGGGTPTITASPGAPTIGGPQ